MGWLIFIFLIPISPSLARTVNSEIPTKEILWELEPMPNSLFEIQKKSEIGPSPRKKEENLDLISQELVKINFSDEVYLDTDPEIPSKWMSDVGERYGFPFAMEFGATFKISQLSFKMDLLGYFNQYVGYPGREYAWRAQLLFFLPD